MTQRSVVRCRVANPLKEALTALADALAKRPAEEILFDWFRSGRLARINAELGEEMLHTGSNGFWLVTPRLRPILLRLTGL